MGAVKIKKEIKISIQNHFEKVHVPAIKFKKLINLICQNFKISKAFISIVVVNDTQIRSVNKRFLKHKSTTDCISFDLSEEKNSLKIFDIIVNGQMAVRQARLRGHSAEAELALYITHGLLHNLKFNDLTIKLAKKMHKTEDKILEQFGYGPVYNKKKN